MYIFSDCFASNASFISAGSFFSNEPWKHSSRIIDSYEIICMIDGVLPMEIGNIKVDVKPGELLLIPPGVPHRGTAKTTELVRFLWFHFTLQNLESVNEEIVLSKLLKSATPDKLLVLPKYNYALDANRIYLMVNQLLDIYQEKVPSSYQDNYLNCILHELSYQTLRYIKSTRIEKSELQPMQDWIRIHVFEDISLQSIADYFNYNKNYLSRKYKKVIGISITAQITKYRMDSAKVLLAETSLSIQEIADQVGYEDAKYFMRVFRKMENMTPTQYRFTFNKRHYNNS